MENEARVGMVVGSLVGVGFGLVFIEVNSGGLGGSWPLVLRVAGAVVAAVLLAGVVWVARRGTIEGEAPSGGFTGRRYWNIVGLEGVALFLGLVLINGVFKHTEYAVPWIALVVGVHFVLLAQAWRIDLYRWLGYAQTLLGLVGFVLAAFGAAVATVNLVSGVLSGVALFVTVAVGILRSRPVTA
ncbi:hypothetical protein [Actinophytocola oryzae]|uniref:Uncharacterized protein n=1 Tax=Actinophytocola oryzae TaxID=502181 RepID=A0A4R7VP32_9PSEU|nr:hypothetical protein [Actinophytocola oryzae]TDV51029.1 hypothetical protein CLV71_106375 [Actinophytocola oryzae]